MKMLITGANGFIGSALCRTLATTGHDVVACVRKPNTPLARTAGLKVVTGGELGAGWCWPGGLERVDAVIHLAARVHVLREDAVDPLRAFRAVNVAGTEALLRASREHGVRRFVHVSSIKAAGDEADPYGQSKLEAEAVLGEYAARGLETVVLRPPLVYGPGVGGNFLRLLRWLDRGVPLPLGGIENRRSLVFIGNLVSALQSCLEHPDAAGRVFGVCDGEDVSTPELLARLGAALGRPARLFWTPLGVLRLAARAVGRGADFGRLCGSLTTDMSLLKSELSWQPPYSMTEGLNITAAWYRQHEHAGGLR